MNEGILRDMLLNGAYKLDVQLDEKAIDKLFLYKDFLKSYNNKVNLTSIVDEKEIILKHFLDSLTVFKILKASNNKSVIDIGTGAGFPGLVLKIARESIKLTLIDSLKKRIVFLEETIKMLSLVNVNCVHARAEELIVSNPNLGEGFDYAVSRAVASLPKLVEYCLPYVKVGGEFVAMKGPNYVNEMDDAREVIKALGGELIEVKEILLPESNITRNLIRIEKKTTGNTKYKKSKK